MVDIQPNIEKKIHQGEVGFSEAFEAEKSLETPQADRSETEVTPESIREQLAKPDGIVSEEFREKVVEPIANGELAIAEDSKDKLNRLMHEGLNAFSDMEGVLAEVEKHRKKF